VATEKNCFVPSERGLVPNVVPGSLLPGRALARMPALCKQEVQVRSLPFWSKSAYQSFKILPCQVPIVLLKILKTKE